MPSGPHSRTVSLAATMLNLLFFLLIAAERTTSAEGDWWTSASLYQIYPLSFKDSDGDGSGDLKGITSEVDYFSTLKVDAVWLSPIYESPFEDGGYDVSNFTKVHPKFGTLEDFTEMVEAFHKKGIKVLLDFVPNHTSDRHPWFQDSLRKINGKDDFYVWANMSTFQTKPLPPTNWKSLLYNGKEPAWTYVKERAMFYLHQFGEFQPDLNYKNPAVVDEMKDVLKFWLNKGVDGFRVDAAPFLVEGSLLDEPKLPNCPDERYSCYNHTYTMNQNKTFSVLKQFEDVLEEASKTGSQKVMFVEAYTDVNNTMRYYGKRTVPFNFFLITHLRKDSNATAFAKAINQWMDNLPKNHPPNWVLGNHDVNRVASRLGKDMINLMNMLVLLLPGTSVTYYGEEIGMVNSDVKNINDSVAFDSRDGERTPFQWNNRTNAGFSNASHTWLPVNQDYYEINVESERSSTNSYLNFYQKLKEFRKTEMADKNWKGAMNISDYVLAVRRDNMVMVLNLDNQNQKVDLTKLNLGSGTVGHMKLSTYNLAFEKETEIDFSKPIDLQAKAGFVMQVPSGAATYFASLSLFIACLFFSLRS
ncbi:alpha-glucosidase-like [Cimex lectularius]|uniref:alpha-glucosidase n=1 Tax=Cimex lectularius TaxID=79782 RepID=A0A8I6S7S3_CIMLE|nr:alpha-glucosidase-like [Cimex lectularius]